MERVAAETGGDIPETKLRMCFKASLEPSKPLQSETPAGRGKGWPSFKESHSTEPVRGGHKETHKS